MANQPFDREILNLRERPLSGDINSGSTELDRSARAVLQNSHLYRSPVTGMDTVPLPIVPALSAGFHGNGFRVRASNPVGLSVVVESGLGWFNSNISESSIGGISGLDDPDPMRPLVNQSPLIYNLGGASAPDGVNPRIDIIEVKMNRLVGDPTTRDVLNPGTGIFAPATVNKTLSYSNSTITTNGTGGINYKTGVAAAIPVAPAVSAGYVKISEVLVDVAALTIAQNKIIDNRRLLFPGGLGLLSFQVVAATGFVTQQRGAASVAIAVNSSFPLHTIRIFAGDATLLAINAVVNQLGNPGTFNNLRIDTISNTTVNGGIQALLAALGTGPLFVAIGQPYTQIDVRCETALVNITGLITLASS